MALDSIDKLIAGLANSSKMRFYKPSLSNAAAGQLHSLWRSNGYPTNGVIPTTAAVCTDDTVGSWKLPTPVGKNYIAKLSAVNSVACQVILFDRLGAMGGLSGVLTTAQSVNMDVATQAAAGRCEADGGHVLWCLEWYTDTGSTAVTATVTYTNQDDVTGRTTTVALAATRRASTLLPILPNTSDIRIKSIQSVQLSATSGTAGNFGVTALVRLAEMPLPIIGVGAIADYASLALPDVTTTSCIMLGIVAATTTTGNLLGSFEVIDG